MTSFQHSVFVPTPLTSVWEAISNVQHWPQWDQELATATSAAPLRLGATGELLLRRGWRWQFRIVEFVDRERYSLQVALPLAHMSLRRVLEIVDADTTRVTHYLILSGPLGWAYRLLIRARLGHWLPDATINLAAYATQITLR